jgi:hypothetical protein
MTEAYTGHALEDLYYAKDSHPKPLAHQLIAECLADYVKRNFFSASEQDETPPHS